MPCDDLAAVARARSGDEDAFRTLVERHGRALYRLACRMTGSPADAEDIVQEAFIRAHRQLRTFEARAGVSTWLYRIAVNCAIDHLRARPRRQTTPLERWDTEVPVPCEAPRPDDLVFAREVRGRVRRALDGLTDEERAAFVLRHYHGCSMREICDVLGLTVNAAKQAVFRAVRKLRIQLRPLRAGTSGDGRAPGPAADACAGPVGAEAPPLRT